MSSFVRRVRGWAAVLFVALIGAAATLNFSSSASAQLPGSGYSFDAYWNCGYLPSGRACAEGDGGGIIDAGPGTHTHTFGWGSADYDGFGSTQLSIDALPTGSGRTWGGRGENVARACFSATCNDQGSYQYIMYFTTSPSHTVYGHGKA